MLRARDRRSRFRPSAAASKHGIQRASVADLCAHDVAPARRAVAGRSPGPFPRGRDRVAPHCPAGVVEPDAAAVSPGMETECSGIDPHWRGACPQPGEQCAALVAEHPPLTVAWWISGWRGSAKRSTTLPRMRPSSGRARRTPRAGSRRAEIAGARRARLEHDVQVRNYEDTGWYPAASGPHRGARRSRRRP